MKPLTAAFADSMVKSVGRVLVVVVVVEWIEMGVERQKMFCRCEKECG